MPSERKEPTVQGTQADFARFAISLMPQALHAFAPPSLNSPLLHGSQTASLVEVHGLTIPSPTAQDRQELHFVDLVIFANVPGSHHWQALFPPGLNCPATQELQRVSAFPLQNEMIPCPTAHSLHGIQALLAVFDISFVLQGSHVLVPPELNSPSLHGAHCVSASTEHATAKPCPTAHDLHGMQADLALFTISFSPQA